jgi:hypothetical protein
VDSAGCFAQRKDFGVRGGVNQGDGSIVGTCDDLCADDGDCAHGNLSLLGALSRFLEGNRHETQVLR